MKRLILLLCFLCGPAVASPGNDGCVGNCSAPATATPTTISPQISPDIRNTNTNLNSQGQHQGQLQGQAQGQLQGQTAIGVGGNQGQQQGQSAVGVGGNQSQTANGGAGGASTSGASAAAAAGASNVGNAQSVQVVNSTPERIMTVGQAPDVLATPTAPCRISVGISGGWLGGAIGFGSSTEDEGCTLRENARLLHNFGQKEAALKLMCNDAKVAAVLSVCATPAQ
jgi:hypothetical protein